MQLVEREGALAQLREAARPGQSGRVALVAGEAGSGKSSLVRAFVDELPAARVVVGFCDSLETPRPFAPVHDWLGGELSASVSDVVAAARSLLAGVDAAVVEDLHWADDATLDLLVLLIRRRASWPGLLVLTYRDDEVVAGHPMARLLGEAAAGSPVRVAVPALSMAAVATLTEGTGLAAQELHARTAGNAFFVTECLASASLDPTANVRDAVLARAARLGSQVRAALEAVAVVPGRCELWLAESLGADLDAVDEALGSGLLVAAPDGAVALRHELARRALLGAVPPGRRRDLHQRAVAALEVRAPVDDTRVVHHALQAGDLAAAGRHAGPAAAAAEAAGARTQAVAHLELAVQHAAPREAAGLWSRLAVQRNLLGASEAAIEAYGRALDLLDDPRAAGMLRARLTGPLSMLGRLEEAGESVRGAVALLEPLGPSEELAYAYAQTCSQHMLARELAEAVVWGRRSLQLAERLGAVESRVYAGIQCGVAEWMAGDPGGLELLRRGLALAHEHGNEELVALGLTQIGSGGGEIRAYEVAVPALQECLDWSERHELVSSELYARSWLGRCQVEQGQWDVAAVTLAGVLRSPSLQAITRITALTALGRLRSRRGDPGADELLEEALALAAGTGQLQRVWPVAAARAEAAWLSGRLPGELALLHHWYVVAARLDYPWARDELALWLTRAGQGPVEERTAATPFALLRVGRYRAAADAWAALGCPYEQADALAASAVDADQLEGLARLEALGAAPAVRRLVAARRAAGLAVPRGPNGATRGNPAGLTDREIEVLQHVARGLTSPQVAAALHLSPKTVGHHVAHVLDKLGARSRAEAVSRAIALGVPLEQDR